MNSDRADITNEQMAQMMARISELEAEIARLRMPPPPSYEQSGAENATFTNEFADETESGSFALVRSVHSSDTQPLNLCQPYPESWNSEPESLDSANTCNYLLTVKCCCKATQDKLKATQRQLQKRE